MQSIYQTHNIRNCDNCSKGGHSTFMWTVGPEDLHTGGGNHVNRKQFMSSAFARLLLWLWLWLMWLWRFFVVLVVVLVVLNMLLHVLHGVVTIGLLQYAYICIQWFWVLHML